MRCLKCGTEVSGHSAFCHMCGEKMLQEQSESTKCLKCGAEVPKDSVFCHVCGEKIQPAVKEGPRCPHCGAAVTAESVFCYACGTKLSGIVNDASSGQHDIGAYNTGNMTEREFYNAFASKNTKGLVIAIVVLCFISIGIVVVNMLLEQNPFYLIDIAVYTPATLLLLCYRPKWVYSLIILCYCVFSSVISVMNAGLFSGILIIIFAIIVMVNTYKLSSAYKEYRSSGRLPDKQF